MVEVGLAGPEGHPGPGALVADQVSPTATAGSAPVGVDQEQVGPVITVLVHVNRCSRHFFLTRCQR